MAAISIGPAVGAGFQLIARRPVTVLAWGALRVAAIAASFGLIGPVWASMMTEVAQQAQAGVALPPAAAARIMSHMMVAQGVGGLDLNYINAGLIDREVECDRVRAAAATRSTSGSRPANQ